MDDALALDDALADPEPELAELDATEPELPPLDATEPEPDPDEVELPFIPVAFLSLDKS